MKYIVRILMLFLIIPVVAFLMIGLILSLIITSIQYILKGGILEDDDAILIWYLRFVIGNVDELWNKMWNVKA